MTPQSSLETSAAPVAPAPDSPHAPDTNRPAPPGRSPRSPNTERLGRLGRPPTLGKVGMWVFLATDAMGFGGLLLAYAMLRVRAPSWPDPAARFDRSLAGALTFVLLFSGGTMSAAVMAAREGRAGATRALLLLTALAGAAFAVGQGLEFHELATARHLGLTADHPAALFYLITGYHGLHVLVGIFVLVLLAAHGPSGDARARVATLEVASLYWQFVDLVWIVLFTVLYLLPPVMGG